MTSRQTSWMTAALVFSLTLTPQSSRASIGLAEWQVSTPGGNLILHADGWQETYGDCIKADDADVTLPPSQREQVYVSHLRRWQYYQGYVAGESQTVFFLFNEVSKQVTTFSHEQALSQAIAAKGLGQPQSNWLTARMVGQKPGFPKWSGSPARSYSANPPTNDLARALALYQAHSAAKLYRKKRSPSIVRQLGDVNASCFKPLPPPSSSNNQPYKPFVRNC